VGAGSLKSLALGDARFQDADLAIDMITGQATGQDDFLDALAQDEADRLADLGLEIAGVLLFLPAGFIEGDVILPFDVFDAERLAAGQTLISSPRNCTCSSSQTSTSCWLH
jgi:hypothetical protein